MDKFLEGFNEKFNELIEEKCKETFDFIINGLERDIKRVTKELPPECYSERERKLLVKGMNFSLKWVKAYKKEFHLVDPSKE